MSKYKGIIKISLVLRIVVLVTSGDTLKINNVFNDFYLSEGQYINSFVIFT